MGWWTLHSGSSTGFVHRTSSRNHQCLVLGLLFVGLVICSALEESVQKECGKSEHKCLCGIPRCIDIALVKDGVQDCVDGSDEGQWDPSKCAIKNTTSENIRFKRAALSELKKVINNGATTTFYEDGRGQLQTRPVGLLTTTMGAFITSGTTTEYITKLLATYIKNTYARIQTTSSRIYHAVPTELPNGENMMIRPTGFIASTISTEVHGYATTAITTDFYRTYIDGTYAQVVSSYSNIYYPPWYTDAIDGTKPPSIGLATASDSDAGLIYATPVLPDSFRTTLQVVNNGKLETVIIAPIVATKSIRDPEPTAQVYLPQELSGNFITKKSSNGNAADIVAELGIVETENENRLRALRPNNIKENEVRVTGTHGNFVHTNPAGGDETTYNVFTGTYVQNMKTFLFFFGNTVLSPTATASATPQQTIVVENGPQKNNVIVDMSKNLKVIVPATKNRATVDSSINGEVMEGVMIEIESSESDMPFNSDFISVDGATQQTPAIGPKIDAITLTLDKNSNAPSAAALTSAKKSKSFSTSASSKSRSSTPNVENEVPTGRKAPAAVSGRLKPTNVQPAALTLPTFTVGQYDNQYDDMTSSPTVADVKLVGKDGESVSSSSSSSSSRKSVPVFQRPASSQPATSNNGSNKMNSYFNVPGTGPRTQKGQPGSFRNPKSTSGRSAGSSIEDVNEIDSQDLQSAASTGRATVTYVGFADFTTTVGNTVIVFMPRTKMLEDLSVHAASKTVSASPSTIKPTAQYTADKVPTTTRVTSTTTEKTADSDEVATTTAPPPKEKGSRLRAPKKDFTPKYLGSSVFGSSPSSSGEIKPASVGSETTIVYSGRQTIFTNLDHHNSKILQRQSGVQTRVIDSDSTPSATPVLSVEPTPVPPIPSSSLSPSDKRSSLFPPRPKYTPKLSSKAVPESSSAVVSPTVSSLLASPVVSKNGHLTTATTAIYQTDKVNPTGLVTSIGGSIVRDSTTTLFTSLIYGTYIDTSYAQIIKSTSTVFFLIPSKTVDGGSESASPAASIFTPPSPTYSRIKPTAVAKFSVGSSSTAKPAVFSYEVTTTTESSDDEANTTPSNYDRAEVSVTTTESIVSANVESSSESTTPLIEDSESKTTTPKPDVDNFESQNEIEGRKVGGNRPAKGQIISDVQDKVSATVTDEEEQTIFVTRTLPTTVYRTYTYYTTFFIPTENEETVTSVISREITSTAVGFVKKTFSNIIPTSTVAAKPVEPSATAVVEDDEEEDELKSIGEELISPTSTQLIYKTFFTTYTYVTTFFTGQTTSLASREEVVSNVVTLTTLISDQPSSAEIVPTSSAQPSSSIEPTKTKSYASPSRSPGVAKELSGKYTASKKFRPSSSSLPRSPLFADKSSTSSVSASQVEPEQSSTLIPSSVVEQTILKTFYTSLTYFTTLFNGVDASTKTRTEVITNIVPTVTRSTVYNTIAPSPAADEVEPTATAVVDGDVEPSKHNVGETTFYTTYTYLSSIFKDGTTYHKSSLDTYTNVVAAGSTIRSGLVKKPASDAVVEPTKVVGRTAATESQKPFETSSDDDLNEVGSHLSETSQATSEETATSGANAVELEGSEDSSTDKSVYNEHEQYEDEKSEEVDENEIVQATPALKTYFTTFTFFTTFYKHGTSTVSSRLETVTNVASETASDHEGASASDTPNPQVLPVYPITYFTTYTYWTTSFRDKTPVVTSREETVSNIVTPGIDDVAPTKTSTYEALSEPTTSVVAAHSTREGKQNNDLAVDVEPSEIFAEVELTTYFTTYTYYTTSYIGDDTVVNSRFETVTNLVTGTIEPTQAQDLVAASDTASVASSDQTPRAIGSGQNEQQLVESTTPGLEEHDYDLPVGLLSTIVNTEVEDSTTTVFSTDVFGTFIDGIYAQVLESTSSILVEPTKASQSISEGMETHYLPDAVQKGTGLINFDEGKVLEGENNNTITFYTTRTYGTVIDNTYAQVIKSTSTVQVNSEDADQSQFKTGILRVTDGSVVESDQKTTTFYTTSVLGTIIENQYAQILESTSRVIINPTKTIEFTTVQPTGSVDIEGSEDGAVTTEEVPTTTEESKEEDGKSSSKRFLGRARASRPAFTPPGSKSFTPFITPFSSRSRAAFAPKRKQTSAVIVTRTDVTPTVTATLAPATTTSRSLPTRGSSFASRQRYRRPEEPSTGTTPSSASGPTPRLPSTLSRTRFQRPRPGSGGAESASEVVIQPTSASQVTGSSPGSRGRGSVSGSVKPSSSGFSRRGSSTFPGVRASATSSSGFRGTGASTSRYNVRGRGSISPTKSATTVKPTAALEDDDEYEVIEYEYDHSPALGSSTTEKATTPSRFGNNRFRLNPRLQASNLVTTTSTTQRTTGGNVAFPKRRTFTKPTLATTSTTSADSDPVAAVVDGVTEILDAGAPVEASSSSSTLKPRLALKNLIKPAVGRTSSGSGSCGRLATTTTTTTPAPRTTTRRAFAPRSRPQGFPSKGLIRPTAGTTTRAADIDSSDDELEYEESKNLPPTANLEAAGSHAAPVIAESPKSMAMSAGEDLQNDESIQVAQRLPPNPADQRYVGEKTFEDGGLLIRSPLILNGTNNTHNDNPPGGGGAGGVNDRRVEGGRLFVSGGVNHQSGRQLATKVMSNGVEVIVKGNKTAYVGYDKTINPFPVTPHPITFPPYTVSKEFHLIDHPNKLHNPIDHLLHSIVRSVSPDLVTKTLLTTFTYFSTVLDHKSSTVVNSREETISNVITQKFRPTIEYTPRVQETPTILPEHLGAFNSYLTNTMTTTYVYYNTFTADSIPIVITRTELVSNVLTVPAYMISLTLRSPSLTSVSRTQLPGMNTQEINVPVAEGQEFILPSLTRVFETETYFTTLLFSKTIFDNDETPTSSKVLTTKEVLTQVVVTEALVPVESAQNVEATPTLIVPSTSTVEKTFYTTFTHFSTFLNGSDSYVESSTHLTSNVVTEQVVVEVEHTPTVVYYDDVVISPTPIASPMLLSEYPQYPVLVMETVPSTDSDGLEYGSLNDLDPVTFLIQNDIIDSGNIDEFNLPPSILDSASKTDSSAPSQLYQPVMIYATKTYFTTYTYFTSILGEGPSATKVQSRTQVVSRVTTEALATELIAQHLNILKLSYLAQHSTLLEVTSSVHEIIPTRTIEGTYVPDDPTSSILWPHWPKDEDEAIMDPFYPNSGINMASITIEPILVHKDFEESMSSEIHHIVNVLTDTIGGSTNYSSNRILISPTAASIIEQHYSGVFSTAVHPSPGSHVSAYEEVSLKSPEETEAYLHDDEFTSPSSDTELDVEVHNFHSTSAPPSHSPTPPLSSAHTHTPTSSLSSSSTTTSLSSLKTKPATSSASPTNSDAFVPVAIPVPDTKTTTEDINEDNVFPEPPDFIDDDLGIVLDSHDTLYNDMNYGDISSLVELFVNSERFGPSSSRDSGITKSSSSKTHEFAYLSSPYAFETPRPDVAAYESDVFSSLSPSLSSEFNQDSLMLLKKTGLSPVYDYSSYDYDPVSLTIRIRPTKVSSQTPHSPIFDMFSEFTAVTNSDEFGTSPKHPDYYDEIKEDEVFKEPENDDLDTTKVYNLNAKETTLSSNAVDDNELVFQIDAAGNIKAPGQKTPSSTKNSTSTKTPAGSKTSSGSKTSTGTKNSAANKNSAAEKDSDSHKVTLGVIERPFAEETDSDSDSSADDRIFVKTTKPGRPISTKWNKHKVSVQSTTPMSAEGDFGVPSGNVHQIHSAVETSTSGELVTVIKFTSDGTPNTNVIKILKNYNQTTELSTTKDNATKNGVSIKKPMFTFPKDKPAPTMPSSPPTKESSIKLKIPIDYADEEYVEDPDVETATQVYHLFIKDTGVGDNSEAEDENSSDNVADKKATKNKKKPAIKKKVKDKNKEKVKEDENEEEDEHEHEHESYNHERRPPTMFSGPGPIMTSSNTGPSTNSANAGGVQVSTGGTSINWKPLLNLGAIGLGGLGASTLTKLSPLLSSMAGYIKHGFSPILARNDTQGQYSTSFKNEKPLFPARYPSAGHDGIGAIVPYQKEPNLIPVGQYHQQKRPTNLLRQPDDSIPRRPIMSHANHEQFQSAATSNRRPLFPQQGHPNSFQVSSDGHPNIYGMSSNNPGLRTDGRLPTSHVVKVVSGTPLQAGPVNRTPTLHHLFRNSGEKKRQPTFIRPPPRSQENPIQQQQQRPSTVLVPMPPPPPFRQQQHEHQHRDEDDEDVQENKSYAFSHELFSHDDQIPPNLNLLRVPQPTEMEQINRPSTMIRPRPNLPAPHSSPIPEASSEVHSTLFPPRNRIPFENHHDHNHNHQEHHQTSSEENGPQLQHSLGVTQKQWPNLPSSTLNSVFHNEGFHDGGHHNPFINSHEEPEHHSEAQAQSSNEHQSILVHDSNEIDMHQPHSFHVVTDRIPVQGHESDEHAIGPQLPSHPSNFQQQHHEVQTGQGIITRVRGPPIQGPLQSVRPNDMPMFQQQHPSSSMHFGQMQSQIPMFHGQPPMHVMHHQQGHQHQQQGSSEELMRPEQVQYIRQQNQHQQLRPTPEFNHVHIPQIPATNIDHQPFRPILENEPPTTQFRPPSHYNGAQVQNTGHGQGMMPQFPHQQQQQHQQPPHQLPSLIPFDFVSTSRRPPPHLQFTDEPNIIRQHLSANVGVAQNQNQNQNQNSPVLLPGMHQIPPWPIETMHGNENVNSHPQFAHPPPFMVQNSNEQQSQEGPLPPPLLPGFFAPTPHYASHQLSPTTVFYVHETYDPPPTQESNQENSSDMENEVGSSSHDHHAHVGPIPPPIASSSHRPPPQELIINEIQPQSQSSTAKSTRLHPTFIRGGGSSTTAGTTTTTESPIEYDQNSESHEHGHSHGHRNSNSNENQFMKSGGFIVSPTVQDMFDRFPSSMNGSRPMFQLDKFFEDMQSQMQNHNHNNDDGSQDKMVGGSEDNVSIIDPSNNHVIKSPGGPSSTASPNSGERHQNSKENHKKASDEDNLDENELLNAFTLPDGFFSSSMHNMVKGGDDFWEGTTFRPFANFGFRENFTGNRISSTTPMQTHNDLVWHDIFPTQNAASSITPNIVDQPTTYRNILQPTTFRPNLFRRPPNEPIRRPDTTRRPNGALLQSASNAHGATANSFFDYEEGIENIKLKNVEIHKKPEFAKGQIRGQHNQHQHPVLALIPASDEDSSSGVISTGTGNSQTASDGSQGFKKPFYSLEEQEENDDEDASEILNGSTGGDIVKTREREQQKRPHQHQQQQVSQRPFSQPPHTHTHTHTHTNAQNEDDETNETLELGPPGYPMTRLRPPPPQQQQQPHHQQHGPRPVLIPQPQPGHGPQSQSQPNMNVNGHNGRRPMLRPILPPQHQPPHPGPGQSHQQQPQRPPTGPFDAITNLFRRPLRPRPDGPHQTPPPHGEQPPVRRPLDGNGGQHLNIVRKPQPPQDHGQSNTRPQPGVNPESTFNKIKPIPLNPAAENSNNVHQNYQVRRPIVPPELVRRPSIDGSSNQRPEHQEGEQQRPFRRPLHPQPQHELGSGERGQVQQVIRRPISSQHIIRRPQRPRPQQHDQSLEGHGSQEHGHHSDEENDIENEVVKQVDQLSTNDNINDMHNQIKEEIENSIEAVRPRPITQVSGEAHDHDGSGSIEHGNLGVQAINGHRPLRPHQRKRIRKPKPFPPQSGTLVVETNQNPSDSSASVEIHEYKDHRVPQPQTEMAPPPIDSLRHKPSVLELPTLPPPAERPRRPNPNNPNFHRIRQRPRPNLLRPEAELLKPTLERPRPTFHTIASVDDDNKIVATNVVPMIHNHHYHESSKAAAAAANIKPSQTLDSAENVISTTVTTTFSEESPEHVEFELASSIVDKDALDSSEEGSHSRESSSIGSVVQYAGGRYQTAALPTPIGATSSPEEDEHVDVSTVVNTRTNIGQRTRFRISTRVHSEESEETASDGAPPIKPTNTVGGFTPINISPTPTKSPQFPFASRRPFTRPRFTTTEKTSTTSSPSPTTPTEGTSARRPVFSRRPFLPTRPPTAVNNLLPWNRRTTSSSTGRPEDDDISNEVDGEDERASEEINVVSTSTTSSVSSKTGGHFSPNAKDRVVIPFKYNRTRLNFFSTTPKITTSTEISISTAEDNSSHKSNEIFKPTTFRPAIRPNLLGNSKEQGSYSFPTWPVSNSTTTLSPQNVRTSTHVSITSTETSSAEDEEQIDAAGAKAKEKRTEVLTKNGTITVVSNNNPNSDLKISPTRTITGIITSNRGVSVLTSVVSSGTTVTLQPDDNENSIAAEKTRYVTSTETDTHVYTETETSVLPSLGPGGVPITRTVIITSTVPPQTLISTIIGSVTLVNSVDIKPTVVRSTIYSESTQATYDTTGSPTEKVIHGQVGIIKTRPKDSFGQAKPTTQDPIIDSSSTHVSITSKESSSSYEVAPKRKIKPYVIEPGCLTHNCSMQGNQVCKAYANGTKSKCVCAPGYARVKSNAPCRPTYTYEMNLAINHMDGVSFNYNDLKNDASDAYWNFITMTKDALDKLFLTTVITRDFQGTEVMKIDPRIVRNEESNMMEPKVNVDFLVQLRKNMTIDKIKGQLIRQLRNSNFTMGKAGLITSSSNISDYSARDFNECSIPAFNDCHENADCINVLGSYRCQCQTGFRDKSRRKKQGRDCIEMAGCAECNYRGNCYTNRIGQTACNCFRWYGGSQCHINLKILLMAIIGIVGVLFLFVLLCGFLLCKRKKRNPGRVLTGPGSGRFMRYRSPTSHATLERAAIMHDSASSSDGTRTPPVRANLHPHHHQQQQHSFTPDSLLIDSDDNKNVRGQRGGGADLMNFSLRNVVMDQQDRSLTVVIPRAKIRSSSRPSSRPNTSSAALGPDLNSDLAAAETKLMSFLDPAPGSKHIPPPPKMPGECSSRQSTSQRHGESKARKLSLQERRISSGALVSSGTEVSARGGMRRRSTGLEPDLPIRPYEKTVSDVRSYDEHTVRSHARPLFSSETSRASCYSCKPPSYCAYSESATGHTMAEKDGASTVYTTQGKLFRLSNDTDSNLSSD